MRRVAVAVVMLAAVSGCEDLIRSFIPVSPTDGEPGFADAGVDYIVPDKLAITSVKPDHGPFVGGSEVTIYGSGFTATSSVRIGGKAIQVGETTALSPVAIQVVTPAGNVGLADVEVQSGVEATTLTGGFRYDPIQIIPDSGPASGGTLVTIQGKETDFASGMKVLLGGKALTNVEVISATMLRGRTPANVTGPADLTFSSATGDQTIAGAFLYYSSTSPKSGGMGGGPIEGTLTVSVLDWLDRKPVPSAKIVVQKERSFTLTGVTSSKGIAVFTDNLLVGPLSVTASQTGFETTTIANFDARDLTIFLMPIPNPQPGPMPPGSLAGTITGHVLFGGATGVGSAQWKIVPEPKGNQVKRVYVYTTSPSVEWGPQYAGSSATIDYANNSTATAWPYTIVGRTGNMAVYAVAGLHNNATQKFEPYAMGITRGVVVGPGEIVEADVWVTIPLTEKVTVQVKDVPPEVASYRLRLAITLGADGLIMRQDNELTGDGVFNSATFGRMPPLSGKGLLDGAYTVDLQVESLAASGLPMVKGTQRNVLPKDGVLLLDQFVGTPQQVKPKPGANLEGNTLMWAQSGAPASLAVTTLSLTDDTPVWRVITSGDVTTVKLPDPAVFGLSAWPTGPVKWSLWLAHLPGGYSFNSYTYAHLSSSYWDRWSFDELGFQVP
jgi:hypothetical protein